MVTSVFFILLQHAGTPLDIALPFCCFLVLVTHICGKVEEPRLSSHYHLLRHLVSPIPSAPWPSQFIRKPAQVASARS
jgi:hypothetical protein